MKNKATTTTHAAAPPLRRTWSLERRPEGALRLTGPLHNFTDVPPDVLADLLTQLGWTVSGAPSGSTTPPTRIQD